MKARGLLLILAGLLCLGPLALAQEVPGNALWFDGTDDWVDCGNDSSVQITGNAITLEAWIKADTWRSNIWEGCIINKEGSMPDNGYMLRCGDNGSANFNLGNGWWNEITAYNVLELGHWHHLAGVYDGSMQYLYVDGQLAASQSNTDGIGNTTAPLYLGSSYLYPDRTIDGTVDEVRIWNVARSQAQIQGSMHDTVAAGTPGLAAYYRFDQTAGDTLYDLTANVNHGVLTNFADSSWLASYAMVQPQSLPAAGITDSTLVANWAAPALGPAPAKYYLDVSSNPSFSDPDTVAGWHNKDMGISFSDTVRGLSQNTNYYYRVWTWVNDTLGNSQPSAVITARTLPAKPPLSGIINVGAAETYTSLTGEGGLFAQLDSTGLDGHLNVLVTSDLNETGQYPLKEIGELGGSGYTLTIAPDAATLRTISGESDSGLIRLNGADRVTIDGRFGGEGRYLLFRNLADGGPALSMYNDASYDTVRHCRLEGWSSNYKKKSAKKPDFSKLTPKAKADWYKNLAKANSSSSKAPYADCVVYLGPTDFTTGNHHLAFEHNFIGDRSDTARIPYELLVCEGTPGKPNSNITIDGNLMANSSYYGINVWDGFGDGWNISNNSFYIQDTLDYWFPMGLWPSNYEPGVNAVIQGNYVGGTDSLCGGSPAIANYEIDALDFGFTYDGHALVQGNVFQNARCISTSSNYLVGIYFWDGSADIIGNIIGHPTDSAKGLFDSGKSTSSLWAIEATGENANLDGNIVANIHYKKANFRGLTIYSDSGYARNNRIYACGPDSNTAVYGGIAGINYRGGNEYGTYQVYNNMVSLIGHSQTPLYGIWDENSDNRMEAYYNTVYLGGSDSTGSSCAFYKDNYDISAVAINNIFYNAMTTVAGGTARNYAIRVNHPDSLLSNNNLLRTSSSDTVASYDNGVTPLSLMQWRDSTGQDSLSVSVLPVFLSLSDLHLDGAQDSISNFAQPIAWITTDIDGDARNATTPTIGCDEYFNPAGIVSEPFTYTKPLAYSLNQARPNPCKNFADISYQLAAPGLVSLKVYNLAGQLVATLVNANQAAGGHSVRWNGKSDQGQNAANGVYLYRLAVNGFSGIGKMVVIK